MKIFQILKISAKQEDKKLIRPYYSILFFLKHPIDSIRFYQSFYNAKKSIKEGIRSLLRSKKNLQKIVEDQPDGKEFIKNLILLQNIHLDILLAFNYFSKTADTYFLKTLALHLFEFKWFEKKFITTFRVNNKAFSAKRKILLKKIDGLITDSKIEAIRHNSIAHYDIQYENWLNFDTYQNYNTLVDLYRSVGMLINLYIKTATTRIKEIGI